MLRDDPASVVVIPAHSDESGSRRATKVKASVPASGKLFGVEYSRIAKAAMQC
jgi:hypothetical protein